MKRILLSSVLVTILCTASFAGKIVAEGKTFSPLGDYTIESSDNTFPMKGNDCKAYTVRYKNTPMEVTVVVCKDHGCKKYVVLSEKLSVQYVCNNLYFGVEMLDESFQKEGFSTSPESLNRIEYFHQKVLGSGQKDEIESTRLIAAYFPMLLNQTDNNMASF